jgi:3-oxoacyl-[acyl-carrier protein] reductase
VAAAVAYLASPGGAYVTGAVLHVNGGMYMS